MLFRSYHDDLNPGNAVIDRADPAGHAFELAGADDVSIAQLSITGGYTAVYAADGADSDRVTLSANSIFGNTRGVYLEASNDDALLSGNVISATEDYWYGYAVYLAGERAIAAGVLAYNSYVGIYASGAGSVIAGCDVDDCHYGIQAYGSVPTDPILVEANTAHGDPAASVGIYAIGEARVTSNTVWSNYYGIQTQGATVDGNVVFDNNWGI